jgi:hypothetical protein
MRGVCILSGDLGVPQAFLEGWYIGGGYMDVYEVVVITIVAKCILIFNFFNLVLWPFVVFRTKLRGVLFPSSSAV